MSEEKKLSGASQAKSEGLVLALRGATQRYRIHLDGFTNDFGSLGALKAWVSGLKGRYPDLIGKTATIHKATSVRGDCATYGAGGVQVVVQP